MIKLFKGKRSSVKIAVQLSDCKTFISAAEEMMFWFYIQVPDGSWRVADIRQLQEYHSPEILRMNPERSLAFIVGYELALFRDFEGKDETERINLIGKMISSVPLNYFLSQGQIMLYE